MNINTISINRGEGFVYPKSIFYSSSGTLSNHNCLILKRGINKLIGEIDCGNWEMSYLLSMYKYRPDDFILSEIPTVLLDNKTVSLQKISKIACYMDESYHLFSSKKTVKELITHNLKLNNCEYNCAEILDCFKLDEQRVERPIIYTGNEHFRAMAAVGILYGKEIFCFPWLSNSRFLLYYRNITFCLEKLADYGKIIVLPVGQPDAT
jgi:hypothetical protein